MLDYTSFAALMEPLKALQNAQDILPAIATQLQNMPSVEGFCVSQKDGDNSTLLLTWNSHLTFNYEHRGSVFNVFFAFEPLPAKNISDAFVSCLEDLLALAQHLKKVVKQTETQETQAYEALRNLRKTQNELIEAEKMTSLAGLVTGMAHELNTPLGIGVTATSALLEDAHQLEKHFLEGTLSKQKMQTFLLGIQEAGSLLEKHLNVASRLIQNFKQISAQQVYESTQTFDIYSQSESIFSALRHRWKNSELPLKIEVTGESPCTVVGYPGVWTQILTELIENSFCHAWSTPENHSEARIILHVTTAEEHEEEGMAALLGLMDERLAHEEGDGKSWDELKKQELCLRFSDNGNGVPEKLRDLLFEPFATRDKSRFGGLGLHMVYNLVHHKLAGEINLIPDPTGAIFEIRVPYDPVTV